MLLKYPRKKAQKRAFVSFFLSENPLPKAQKYQKNKPMHQKREKFKVNYVKPTLKFQ